MNITWVGKDRSAIIETEHDAKIAPIATGFSTDDGGRREVVGV